MDSGINRSIITITHLKPYLDWGKSLDTGENIPVPKDGNAYLMEEIATGTAEEVEFYLKKHWREIADEEFESWSRLPSEWPKLNSLADFKKYFTFEHRELVFDLCDHLLRRDYEDDEDESDEFQIDEPGRN